MLVVGEGSDEYQPIRDLQTTGNPTGDYLRSPFGPRS